MMMVASPFQKLDEVMVEEDILNHTTSMPHHSPLLQDVAILHVATTRDDDDGAPSYCWDHATLPFQETDVYTAYGKHLVMMTSLD
jgi:hypothetical protein